MITGVAIKHKDVVICLPKPNRHHDCIRYAIETLGLTPPINSSSYNQGFYLADGSFLNRIQAKNYVKENNLPTINEHHSEMLFSEDLW